MSGKSFQDLIDEVHSKGICQMCGGCVSFCSSAEYGVIGFKDTNSPPEFINKENCLECGICYQICPQTHVLDDNLNKNFNFLEESSLLLGNYIEMYSSQTTDKDFLRLGTDGGVVNSLINFLIEKKDIDGAIVAKSNAPFSREAIFINNRESLIEASGLMLEISPQSEGISQFCTYTQSLPKLSHYKFKKLAIVGTPCQIYTIRCMQDLGVTPSENVEICLGLFCYENFIFDNNNKHQFEKNFNIQFQTIERINIKDSLIVKLKDSNGGRKVVKIPFHRLKEYVRPACNACSDFTNIYADISFGGLGSKDKFTTVITRTGKGQKLFLKALNSGIITSVDLEEKKKNNIKALVTQFAQSKKKRKENYINNLR